MEKIDKSSRYLLIGICLVFILILFFSYYNIFIKADYIVTKQIPCDPQVDTCFVSDCEANDSTCDSTTTYMKIEVSSKYAGSDYDSLSCEAGNVNCQIITCNVDTAEDGEKCFE